MSFFDDLFGNTGRRAALEAMRAAEANRVRNDGIIGEGLKAGRGFQNESRDLFRPLSELGRGLIQSTGTMLPDSMGLGGQAGADRAQAAFRLGNPYMEQAGQNAMEALSRRANVAGMLGSGNTLNALFQNNAAMMGDAYNRWQDRLGGLTTLGASTMMQGNQGQANALNQLTGLEQWGVGARTGNNNAATQASNQFALQAAQAASQGAGNALGLGLNLANLAFGGLGSLAGGGFNLASLGGGGAPTFRYSMY